MQRLRKEGSKRIALLSALVLLGPQAARSQIAVEILNMPAAVYSFEPVYVLYAVENTGSSPAYLAAGGWPGQCAVDDVAVPG